MQRSSSKGEEIEVNQITAIQKLNKEEMERLKNRMKGGTGTSTMLLHNEYKKVITRINLKSNIFVRWNASQQPEICQM